MAGKSDGTVYIDTRIDTSGIDKGMSTTQNKINSLGNALGKLGTKIKNAFSGKLLGKESSAAVQDYSKQIQKLESQLDKLIEKQIRFVETGGDTKSRTMSGMEYDIEQVRQKLEELRAKQAQVAQGVNTRKSSTQFLELKDSLIKVGQAAGSALSKVLKLASGAINTGLKKLSDGFKKLASHLLTVDKNAKKSNYSIMKMLGTSVLFSTVFRGINLITTGFKDGILEMAKASGSLNSSLSSLKTSLFQLRNSFVAAFEPIISFAIPYLDKFMSYISQALNYVSQFMAALVGQDTYKKVIRVEQSIGDTASSLDKVKDSAKDAEKALKGYLSPLDEINRYSSPEKVKVPGVGDVGKADDALMFEEVAIAGMFKDMADKFKMLAGSLFEPLKKAWEEAGQFVMDSWLFALDEAWLLIKDIGKDFLEVWNQEETVNIFEDILRIVGDIGLVIGTLIEKFREAWNYADTGKKILEGIRDIIGVITDNVLHAADATVEWAKEIDFVPILTKIQELIASLVPVFDNLSGILTDFYEKVLLPLGEWALEEGLPELLQVFIDFNNEVDWDALRDRLAEFWEHLEPFAETVGEGLIEFVDRIVDALANFVNSGEFENFLTSVENWMDNVEADKVADAFENFAKALVALKVAVLGFSAVSKGIDAITKLSIALSALGKALAPLKSIKIAPILTALFTTMNPGMIGEIGIKVGDLLTGSFLDPREWENWLGDLSRKVNDAVNKAVDWIGQNVILKVFEWLGNKITESIEEFKNIFNWEETFNFFELAGQAFENVETAFNEKDWGSVGKNILLGVLNGITGALSLITEPIKSFFDELWENFCEVFGINSPAENMKPLGEYILLGVIEGIKNVFEKVKETIEELKTIMSEKFEEIGNAVKEKFEKVKENIFEKLTEIKTDWDTKWDEFASKISSVWDTIKTSISDAITSIKGWISDLLSKFEDLKSKSSSLKGSVISTAIKIPTIVTGSTYSVPVPALASGTVIPPNAPFMAILGDQRRGTNIEAPLDTIKQAVREVIGHNGNGATYHFVAQLEGQTLFEQFVSQAQLNQMATGQNVLATL